MRAQQAPLFARQVKRVLRIASRMIRRRVQRVKTMILVLHFRPGGNCKAQSPKAPHNLLSHPRQRMKPTPTQAASGQAEVSRMLRLGRLALQNLPPPVNQPADGVPHFVNGFARRRPLFFRQPTQLPQQAGDYSLRAKILHPNFLQPRQIRRRFHFQLSVSDERLRVFRKLKHFYFFLPIFPCGLPFFFPRSLLVTTNRKKNPSLVYPFLFHPPYCLVKKPVCRMGTFSFLYGSNNSGKCGNR